MPYRIEVSPNKRAACRGVECAKLGVKIGRDEVRLGVWVKFQERGSYQWRHWSCVTPSVIANLKQEINGDVDMLDGYAELPEDAQKKLRRALEQGHIDDEDFKGDVEVNRPGMRGFRVKQVKRKASDVDDDDEDEEAKGKEKDGARVKGKTNKRAVISKNQEAKVSDKPSKKARGKEVKREKSLCDDNDNDDGEDKDGCIKDLGDEDSLCSLTESIITSVGESTKEDELEGEDDRRVADEKRCGRINKKAGIEKVGEEEQDVRKVNGAKKKRETRRKQTSRMKTERGGTSEEGDDKDTRVTGYSKETLESTRSKRVQEKKGKARGKK